MYRHGAAAGKKKSEYNIWVMMRQRCNNPRNKRYKDYGGRGITVCERWDNSFTAFLSDMGLRPPGTSIERKNNDGNYEPGNCIWATREQQALNTRSNLRIEINGVTKTLTEWADHFGVPRELAYSRYWKKQPVERVFDNTFTPLIDDSVCHRAVELLRLGTSITKVSSECGISRGTVCNLKSGKHRFFKQTQTTS